MIWLLTRLVVVPVKAALGGAKLGFWTGRFVGYRRLAVLGVGVGVGLLVAPRTGEQARARLRKLLGRGPSADITLPGPGNTKVVVATPPPAGTTPSPSATRSTATATPATAVGQPGGPLPAAPEADPALDDRPGA